MASHQLKKKKEKKKSKEDKNIFINTDTELWSSVRTFVLCQPLPRCWSPASHLPSRPTAFSQHDVSWQQKVLITQTKWNDERGDFATRVMVRYAEK